MLRALNTFITILLFQSAFAQMDDSSYSEWSQTASIEQIKQRISNSDIPDAQKQLAVLAEAEKKERSKYQKLTDSTETTASDNGSSQTKILKLKRKLQKRYWLVAKKKIDRGRKHYLEYFFANGKAAPLANIKRDTVLSAAIDSSEKQLVEKKEAQVKERKTSEDKLVEKKEAKIKERKTSEDKLIEKKEAKIEERKTSEDKLVEKTISQDSPIAEVPTTPLPSDSDKKEPLESINKTVVNQVKKTNNWFQKLECNWSDEENCQSSDEILCYFNPKIKNAKVSGNFLIIKSRLSSQNGLHAIVFQLQMASSPYARQYGYLPAQSPIELKFLDGKKLVTKSLADSRAIPLNQSLVYTIQVEILSSQLIELEENALDYLAINWQGGSEEYPIQNIDLYKRQITCQKNCKK